MPDNKNETLAGAGANTQSDAQKGKVEQAQPAPAPDTNVVKSIPSSGVETATPMSESGIPPKVGDTLRNSLEPLRVAEGDGNTLNTSQDSSASDVTDQQEGTDLYEHMASLSNFANTEYTKFNDGANRKIECIFVDKLLMNSESAVYCNYGFTIKKLIINSTVTNYGITASIHINDSNGIIQSLVNHQSNFYCVINILEVFSTKDDILQESGSSKIENGIMFCPYIFEIENVKSLSPDGAKEKTYEFQLIDIVSATLKKVSYGNLLIWNPSFIQSTNFAELYQNIINFAAEIIAFAHNKKYYFDKHIYFIDDITDSYNDLIKNVILRDLSIEMTCYDLLNHIYKHAAREIEAPSQFSGENPGNILIPMMLQDEFEDISSMYRQYFNRDTDKVIVKDINFSGKFSINAQLIKRGLYAKCLLMPFELAFNADNCYIYENINPVQNEDGSLVDHETNFQSFNGLVISALNASVDIPPSNYVVGLGWKNLSLLSDTPSGGNNMLIYFNWIYEFYKAAFLNDKESFIKKAIGKKLQPTIDPHFHRLESLGLNEGDKETFAKINSNTIALKSTDTVKEALYHVGRALKSYIFLNALSGFKIKGSVFRHAGEIIKITNTFKSDATDGSTAAVGGVDASLAGFSLNYITNVTHIFQRKHLPRFNIYV